MESFAISWAKFDAILCKKIDTVNRVILQ